VTFLLTSASLHCHIAETHLYVKQRKETDKVFASMKISSLIFLPTKGDEKTTLICLLYFLLDETLPVVRGFLTIHEDQCSTTWIIQVSSIIYKPRCQIGGSEPAKCLVYILTLYSVLFFAYLFLPKRLPSVPETNSLPSSFCKSKSRLVSLLSFSLSVSF